ncbi:hypothetical protein DWB85_07485 [Seongchinamella sediminis]|uniref:Uncharacterized protein n=1 Tax=Seongchinamella sediminis TaxID=2283635 RepID=A0A3L7E290_9GAMM|nr:hypothetical protein [Seongchinamella sediminis]RLQ22453.1 hypothetical protein DWB85_07485 [Seongchinamella sediminis]
MLKVLPAALLACCLIVTALFAIAWHLPQPRVHRDPPRELPWPLPDHRQAQKNFDYLPDGRIRVITHHLPLPGVTPAMLAWFYRQLPISTVDIDGTTHPLYHLFHPTEHGQLWVVEAAPDGTPGMARGAVIERHEWFSRFDSQGRALISEFSDQGMTAIARAAGLQIGVVEHRYRVVDGQTRYVVTATIGSDLPLLGTLLNSYLRNRVFTRDMIPQWMRHQVEEVGTLPYFLPALYAQRGAPNNHFVLRSAELHQGLFNTN